MENEITAHKAGHGHLAADRRRRLGRHRRRARRDRVDVSAVWLAGAAEAGDVARLLVAFRDWLGGARARRRLDRRVGRAAARRPRHRVPARRARPRASRRAGVCQLRFRHSVWTGSARLLARGPLRRRAGAAARRGPRARARRRRARRARAARGASSSTPTRTTAARSRSTSRSASRRSSKAHGAHARPRRVHGACGRAPRPPAAACGRLLPRPDWLVLVARGWRRRRRALPGRRRSRRGSLERARVEATLVSRRFRGRSVDPGRQRIGGRRDPRDACASPLPRRRTGDRQGSVARASRATLASCRRRCSASRRSRGAASSPERRASR